MVPFNTYKHVFTPIQVGPLKLKSRIEFSPMVCDLTSPGGYPLQDYIDFVEKQAMSGVGLITLGATPVNWENAVDYDRELDVTSEEKVGGLVKLAEAAHRFGAKLSVELVHAGRGADPNLITVPYGIAPSNFPIPGQIKYIKEMDQHDIEKVIADYVDCATRLQRCGFDAVMIHGAHGNLLAQFLSPLVNHRTDIYGGSFENRCRFPLMLLKAVRRAVGKKFMIEYRISGDEIVPNGMRTDEVIEFLKLAQDYIDLANISAGLIVDWRAQFYTMPPYYRPKGSNVPYARMVKQCPDIHIPVSVVGGIISAEQADQIIDEGSADMCAIARALLSDPDMLNKSYQGHPEEVRPCLRCWNCGGWYGSHITCAVNPQLGRTPKYSEVVPARRKKKVVVVGGGVAGCQAAQTLIERGHDVVVFEKSDRLGGLLNDISLLDFKDDMLRYKEWVQRTTAACGADIRLNTEATPELVMAEAPDAIVVAVGGKAAHPPIPGLDGKMVCTVRDVDSGRVKIEGNKRIVVCGGGLSGCESALQLAMDGHTVTVVDQIPAESFAAGVHRMTWNCLMFLLKQNGVKLIGDHIIRSIDDSGVTVEGRDWRMEKLEADCVVDALGVVPQPAVVESFRRLIPEVYAIGDSEAVKNIKNAVHSAYDICCNI
jgi:2,4-dienoyl-CoA reductase-like NADH-dependent reductase (Old Yellow Enzyme family)/thioredoxin reductase